MEFVEAETLKERGAALRAQKHRTEIEFKLAKAAVIGNKVNIYEHEISKSSFVNSFISTQIERQQQMKQCEIELLHNRETYKLLKENQQKDHKNLLRDEVWNTLKGGEISKFKQEYKIKIDQLKK